AAGGEAPAYGQCVGYEKPLYLGGEDEVSNLQMEDMSVCWSISAQLLARTRGLPVGTRIKKVSIE
ncbi:MAG: T6SS immunity protein Tdi1 domain-containing protein, partial [Myxococcota bacterium]